MSTVVPVTVIHHATQSGYRAPTQVVVQDAAAWAAAWAGLAGGTVYAEDTRPAPAIDFARHTVVVLALGDQPSGGFDIRVDSAGVAADGATEVRATRTVPGPRCMSMSVITSPVVVARVARAGRPVRIVVRDATSAC